MAQRTSSTASSTSSMASSTATTTPAPARHSRAALEVNRRKPVPQATVAPTPAGSAAASATANRSLRAVFKAGRPPWYNYHGKDTDALVIGVCGGSASGKTTVANRIIERLGVPWVCLLSMDSFYKVLNEEEHDRANKNNYNFDHPDAFDLDLLVKTLSALRKGKSVDVPIYDFKTHSRSKEKITMYGANVIVFEGILAFCTKEVRDLLDVKIFVVEDADVRLARRLLRDTMERGRSLEGSLMQYERFVYPAFKQHIEPTMQYADLVVPNGAGNVVAMDLIISHVKSGLAARGFDLRHEIMTAAANEALPTTLHMLPRTKQLDMLYTIIRNRKTDRANFVFYAERITRLLMEYALSFLSYQDVVTPSGYVGRRCNENVRRALKVCGVSIVRAGLTMEKSLRAVVDGISIGQILIQTNPLTLQPEFFHLSLPQKVRDAKVFLMDATIASGAAASMAIRVLLDHDVPQENIILLTLLASRPGVATVAYAFPKVKIVAGALDQDVSNDYHIVPGFGNFGDRYYGTEAVEEDGPECSTPEPRSVILTGSPARDFRKDSSY